MAYVQLRTYVSYEKFKSLVPYMSRQKGEFIIVSCTRPGYHLFAYIPLWHTCICTDVSFPPSLKNNKHVEFILFGEYPTVYGDFTNGSCIFSTLCTRLYKQKRATPCTCNHLSYHTYVIVTDTYVYNNILIQE